MRKSESKKSEDATPIPKIPKKVKDKLKPYIQKLLSKCSDVTVIPKTLNLIGELTEFFEILDSIRDIEKLYSPAFPNRENGLQKFYDWCSEHKAKFNSVSFKEIHEGNFGAVAETDIKENESFLCVPRKIMMSELTAKSSKLDSLISSDLILQHMPNVQIALHLIMEFLNPNSFWKPYISILPSNFNTVHYFTLAEFKELQGSPVLEEAVKILYSIARQYCYFHQLFQANSYARSLNIGPYFTYDLYRWAVSVVMTRQNLIPSSDGTASIISLVPLFDMCNHATGRLTTDFSLKEDMLISYSCRAFSKGDEVCIFYGKRTNREFFLHNAFVYPENENDGVQIKLGMGKNDPLLSLKKDLCSKLKVPINGPFYIYEGGHISPELLSFLEINVMKADELQTILNEQTEKNPSEMYSDLKKRALKFLKDRICLLLTCYRTRLEEDEDLLKSSVPETYNLRLILQLRICEKRILHDAYEFCVESTS